MGRFSKSNSHSKSKSRASTPERDATRRVMKEREIEPSYGMGQNFMTDRAVAAWIVDQLDVRPEETVIEVGPGMGALTEHLVTKGARRVVLIEKDDKLVEFVRGKFGHLPGVEILHADAIRFDARDFYAEQPVKILGALPYSCGTEIIRNLMSHPSPACRAVFTLQKEVCLKLSAKPHDHLYGLLTLRSQAWWDIAYLRELPPDIFVPRPAVDSGVIAMTPRARHGFPVFEEKLFDRLLTHGFSQRRKMLRNLLPKHPDLPWEELAARIGCTPLARAQELGLRQWVDLTNEYDADPKKGHGQSGEEVFDVVDENDHVVRQELRRIVHAENLLHRAVHLFVYNESGEIFLQLRSHLKDKMPCRWDSSAAGHVDSGEDYLTAAVREIEEELGIKTSADRLRLETTLPAGPGTGWEFVHLYSLTWTNPLRWPAAEIETGQWFTPEQVDAWVRNRPQDFAEGFMECWRRHRGDATAPA
ncbi:MAG: dimethyladenosine transferase [Verrucomicrobiales bacterium]|nr:dimethyladenosine transferase [Verrucomicrobiales bacterium]